MTVLSSSLHGNTANSHRRNSWLLPNRTWNRLKLTVTAGLYFWHGWILSTVLPWSFACFVVVECLQISLHFWHITLVSLPHPQYHLFKILELPSSSHYASHSWASTKLVNKFSKEEKTHSTDLFYLKTENLKTLTFKVALHLSTTAKIFQHSETSKFKKQLWPPFFCSQLTKEILINITKVSVVIIIIVIITTSIWCCRNRTWSTNKNKTPTGM